jgi:2-aminoadipate aminotransferase apoenzyme (EC 2.6.1.39)
LICWKKNKGITQEEYNSKVYLRTAYLSQPCRNPDAGKKKKKIIDLACEYDLLVVEDDPYGKLRYEGDKVKPIKAFDDEEHVLYLGTSSKILCPGFRLGWSIGPKEIIRKMVIAKQSMDLCTNVFSQWIACEILAKEDMLDKHIEEIIKLYRPRRDAMIKP